MVRTTFIGFWTLISCTALASETHERVFDLNSKLEIKLDDCTVFYPFKPAPENLQAEFIDGDCYEGGPVGSNMRGDAYRIQFSSNGKKDSIVTAYGYYSMSDNRFTSGAGHSGSARAEWSFSDGEIWTADSPGSSEWYKVRDTDSIERKKSEKEALAETERQRGYERFRKSLKVGDETNQGLVIELRGPMAKVQTSESQCTQVNYDGNCLNYINTSVEKWIKLSELYPR